MKIFSAAQTRALDQATLHAQSIRSEELMARAGVAFCAWLLPRVAARPNLEAIHIVCGPGNNGGDGLVVARQLYLAGYGPQVWLLPAPVRSADFLFHQQQLPGEVSCRELAAEALPALSPTSLVVDALFGTGLSRPLTGLAATVAEHLNRSGATVVAIDMPSGLLTDAPQPPDSVVVRAQHTVSFELPKLAFLLPQNTDVVGQWHLVPIQLDSTVIHNTPVDNYFVTADFLVSRLPKRAKFAHKGTYGHGLLLAGSRGKVGAAVLAARACLRGGVGLLTVRVPQVGYAILQTSAPEAMALADPNPDFVTELPDLAPYAAVGLGPGLGQESATAEVLRQLLQAARVPLVLDADALNLLGANRDLLPLLPPDTLLTPHPKEFERLYGAPAADDYQRLTQLRTFAQQHRCYCLLKGAYSALATPEGRVYFNSTGNPGMATGGSGDVLTGLLLALRADKRLSVLDAALLGVYAHGRAGDLAAAQTGEAGLVAGDMVRYIGPALQELTSSAPLL